MIVEQALQQAALILNNHNIEDAFIESRILLGHILKLSSAELYSRPERIIGIGR